MSDRVFASAEEVLCSPLEISTYGAPNIFVCVRCGKDFAPMRQRISGDICPIANEAQTTKWDLRFMELARSIASWSKDPSTQVGCVLVNHERHIIATGYNGFPRGVRDAQERLEHRPTKYLMVQHAEANAVVQAVASTRGATAYVTHHPCANCAGILIQAGVSRVVTISPSGSLLERFCDSFTAASTMLDEAGVALDFLAPPDTC